MKTKILLTLTQNQNNMKRLFLVCTILFCITFANAQNPFEAYGYTPKIATLSNGKYNEFHDLDTIVQIGTVLFNTQTKQIVAFLQVDTLYSEATLQPDIVSMWLSPDPLASEFPSFSPYNYCYNNPIRFVDPDGLAADDPPWVYNKLYTSSMQAGHLTDHDIKKNTIGAISLLVAPAIILGAEASIPYIAAGTTWLASNPSAQILVAESGALFANALIPGPDDVAPTPGPGGEIGNIVEASIKTVLKSNIIPRISKTGNVAFDIANSGGKHSGFLKNYMGRNVDELNKSIHSLQYGKRGINTHLDKIANPSKYVDNWNQLTPAYQNNLIKGWQKEIKNGKEQIEILNTLKNIKD